MTTFLGIPLSTFIELVASGVVAIGTIFAGLVARQSVVEARKLRQMQDEPHIVVTLWQASIGGSYLDLWVENTGTGTAYDLRLKVDLPIKISKDKYLSDVGVFAHGIPCFPAGHKLAFYVGEVSKMHQDGSPNFTISATYRNSRRVPYNEAFPLNVDSQDGMFQLKATPLDQIARSLAQVSNTLQARR